MARTDRKSGQSERVLRFPVISHGAEFLVQGYLMRRNILTYKAPQNNEGYDLICIHPDPKEQKKPPTRIQVKSRYAIDCDRTFPVKERTFAAFDFLIVVFLNVGIFFRRSDSTGQRGEPEFYTPPVDFIKQHHNKKYSWGKVSLRGKKAEIEQYKNELGFELIVQALGIPYPSRGPTPIE